MMKNLLNLISKRHFQPITTYRGTFYGIFFLIIIFCCSLKAISKSAHNNNFYHQKGVIKIEGRVVDNNGNPLVGVSVQVKGRSVGTITDANGTFSLQAEKNSILEFTLIGYKKMEVKIGDQRNLTITLNSSATGLDEVVVVGYGTQSKRNVTGAISSIKMSETENLPNVNVTQSLSGVAGVQFVGSGRPGQDGNLLIRGQNSLSGQNNPLVVLDGIIFDGSLSDINPQDIETIDILKDASSEAIYGSRAANGVILITSKKGTTKHPAIRFNGFAGISDPSYELKLLSPERYIERRLDWRKQTGLEADPSKIASYLSTTEAENYKNGISHNPWDIISQKGQINSYDLSVSGRTESFNYYLSGSTSEDKGLIFNDNQKRRTFRTNISTQITNWLNVGVNAIFSHQDLSGLSANVQDAYRNSPYGTWYYPDGGPTKFPVSDEQASVNPMWNTLLTTNQEIHDNLFSNFFVKLDVPFVKGLSYRLNYSPNFRWQHSYNYMRQDPHLNFNNTVANKSNQNSFDWVIENIINYKRQIGNANNLDLTFLYGRNHSELESTNATANQLSIDALGFNNLGLGNIQTTTSSAQKIEGISYMGRLNYQLFKKYLFTVTIRKDGSSVFSVNNKYATFPSGAFAWIISDEPFMKKANFIDNLKLRLSYGSVGNQAIAPYQSLTLSGTARYVFGNGGPSTLGVVTSTLGNDDLKWETTNSADIGLDFDLFKGIIGGTIETYNSNTNNLLVRRSIPVMNGYTSILTNIGQTNNRGVEITLNSINIKSGKFKWSSNINFSYNRNKIIHLFRTDLDGDGKEDNSLSNRWFIGQPINSFYDYVFDGIYQDGDHDIPSGMAPGFVRVKDLNGDGKLNAEDRKVVGSGGNPKYQFGIRNNFSYGNFTLSVFVNGMQGWEAPFNLINPLVPGRALNQIDAGWWTAENKSNSRPSLVYNNPLGTSWYLSRNFVRIRDVSLSYNFSRALLDKLRLSDLRLFVSGKNLYTFTKWLGSDPESGGSYTSPEGSTDIYPMPRTIAFGVNLAF